MYEKPPFQPTKCACPADQRNCTRQPGYLIPGQMRRILETLGKTIADAGVYFWNSPGMVVMNKQEGIPTRIRTITPRLENGACVFYKDGRCSIAVVAPFGCRDLDIHMTAQKAQRRAAWGVEGVMRRLFEYETERDALPEATSDLPKPF